MPSSSRIERVRLPVILYKEVGCVRVLHAVSSGAGSSVLVGCIRVTTFVRPTTRSRNRVRKKSAPLVIDWDRIHICCGVLLRLEDVATSDKSDLVAKKVYP